jgi:hypothetical protein
MNIDKILHKEVKDWLYHKASDKPLSLGDDKIQVLIDRIKNQLIIHNVIEK